MKTSALLTLLAVFALALVAVLLLVGGATASQPLLIVLYALAIVLSVVAIVLNNRGR